MRLSKIRGEMVKRKEVDTERHLDLYTTTSRKKDYS